MNTSDIVENFEGVVHETKDTISKSQRLGKLIVDMETGQRGFIITGDESFLEPFVQTNEIFDNLLADLREDLSGRPEYLKTLERIEHLRYKWLGAAGKPEIQARRQINESRISLKAIDHIVNQGTGKLILDNIRTASDDMLAELRTAGKKDELILLTQISKDVVDSETGQRGFLLAGRDRFLEPYYDGQLNFGKHVKKLEAMLASDKTNLKRLSTIKSLYEEWLAKAARPEIQARINYEKDPRTMEDLANIVAKKTGKKIIDQLREVSDELTNSINKDIEGELSRSKRSAILATIISFAVGGIGLFSAIILSFFLSKSIIKSIIVMQKGTEIIGGGDLTHRIKLSNKDELGVLAGSFNGMTEELQRKTDSINSTNKQLKSEISERKEAEESLRESEKKLSIKNRISEIFLTTPDEKMYGEVLSVVLDVMESPYGTFAYINEDGDRIVPSMTRDIWDKCKMPDKGIFFPRNNWGDTLWAKCLIEKKSFSSNGPFTFPHGHIQISRSMATPILHNGKSIGNFMVGDKSIDYTENDRILLEDIADLVAPVLYSRLLNEKHEKKRKQAEEALRESEKKYRNILENIDDGYFEVDISGSFIFFNDSMCKILGYSGDELMGMNNRKYMDEENAKKVYHAFNKVYQTGIPTKTLDWKLIRKNGSACFVETVVSMITNSDNQGIGFRGIARDISEHKQLEGQLRQAQKMESVGRLAGGVAHDYNNALSVIIGFTEMAIDDVDPDGPLSDNLKEVLKASKRAANITRQLLAFARKQTIAPTVLDLNDNVEGMLKMLRRLIGEDIDLTWSPGAGLWPVKMDPSQIDQILANLCVNARDAIDGVGKVTIETENKTLDEEYCANHPGFVPGEFVLLSVSDNGCGIDKETLGNIFEPFFTTKEVGKGTGLGLATIYGIAKQNNGFVNVYSEPDKGTTFKIYLPRHGGGEGVSIQEESTAQIPQGRGETVLVVDDDAPILKLARQILKNLGYIALTAGTPEAAITLAKEHAGDIDLLITDIIMPVMNGRDLAKQLQSHRPGLKCIYMSGYTADIIATRGVIDKGECFIQKPFSKRDLAIIVRKVLEE
jgi:PAS domain S-box-containing protein